MKSSLILCGALALVAAGCRTNPNQVLIEREHRELEDENYQLEDELKQSQTALESCRRENLALKKGGVGIGDGDLAPPIGRSRDATPVMPKIDLGTPAEPSTDATPHLEKAPIDRGPGLTKPTAEKPAMRDDGAPAEPSGGGDAPRLKSGDSQAARSGAVRPASLSVDIEHLSINRWLTGPSSFGTKPGNEGLTVVFGPRDAAGRPLETSGDVSIVVIDPQAEGEDRRVARWDFSAPEVAAHYRQTSLVKALRFELVWPDAPPKHDDVKLYVRLTTSDGRKFDDNFPLHLKKGAASEPQAWNKAAPSPLQQWAPATGPIDSPQSADVPIGLADTRPAKLDGHDGDWRISKSAQPAEDHPKPSSEVSNAASPPISPPPRSAKARPTWSPYR